jgi:hypothetical protein
MHVGRVSGSSYAWTMNYPPRARALVAAIEALMPNSLGALPCPFPMHYGIDVVAVEEFELVVSEGRRIGLRVYFSVDLLHEAQAGGRARQAVRMPGRVHLEPPAVDIAGQSLDVNGCENRRLPASEFGPFGFDGTIMPFPGGLCIRLVSSEALLLFALVVLLAASSFVHLLQHPADVVGNAPPIVIDAVFVE